MKLLYSISVLTKFDPLRTASIIPATNDAQFKLPVIKKINKLKRVCMYICNCIIYRVIVSHRSLKTIEFQCIVQY